MLWALEVCRSGTNLAACPGALPCPAGLQSRPLRHRWSSWVATLSLNCHYQGTLPRPPATLQSARPCFGLAPLLTYLPARLHSGPPGPLTSYLMLPKTWTSTLQALTFLLALSPPLPLFFCLALPRLGTLRLPTLAAIYPARARKLYHQLLVLCASESLHLCPPSCSPPSFSLCLSFPPRTRPRPPARSQPTSPTTYPLSPPLGSLHQLSSSCSRTSRALHTGGLHPPTTHLPPGCTNSRSTGP